MTTKADFSVEEWSTLRAVFCALVMNVAMADHKIATAEAKAGHKEIDALTASAEPLVCELLLEDAGKCADDAVVAKAGAMELPELLAEAQHILHQKATLVELNDYKRSVRSLAIAVAEADQGGDDEENQLLAHLNDWLMA